jgi:hypothetical protein
MSFHSQYGNDGCLELLAMNLKIFTCSNISDSFVSLAKKNGYNVNMIKQGKYTNGYHSDTYRFIKHDEKLNIPWLLGNSHIN